MYGNVTTNESIFINITNATTANTDNSSEILTAISEIVCVVIFVVGLLGNSLVLIVFSSRWSHLKACEIFMISLAFADLVSTILTPSVQFLETRGVDFKPIGNVGCKLIHFSIMTGVTVSSITLMAITFERYVVIKWPFRGRITFSTIRYVVLLTWLLGSGPGIVYLVNDNVRLHELPGTTISHCRQWIPYNLWVIHTMVTFSIQVVIPLLVMIVLYSLTTYELWKTTKTIQFQMRERQMRERYERHKKVIKLLVVLVILFFICTIPFNVLFVTFIFKQDILPRKDLIRLLTILAMLHMANSCINPVIYSRLHTSFRRMALKIFCSCWSHKAKSYEWIDLGENVKSVMRRTVRYASHRFSKPVLFGRPAGPVINGELAQEEKKLTDDAAQPHNKDGSNRPRRQRTVPRSPLKFIAKEKGIQSIINNVNSIPLLVSPSDKPPASPVAEDSYLPSYDEVVTNSTTNTNSFKNKTNGAVVPSSTSNASTSISPLVDNHTVTSIDTTRSVPFTFNRSEYYKSPERTNKCGKPAYQVEALWNPVQVGKSSPASINGFISSSIFESSDK